MYIVDPDSANRFHDRLEHVSRTPIHANFNFHMSRPSPNWSTAREVGSCFSQSLWMLLGLDVKTDRNEEKSRVHQG